MDSNFKIDFFFNFLKSENIYHLDKNGEMYEFGRV